MNIKTLRNSTKMTQKEFAKRFHIPVRTLQEWEQERSMPPNYVIFLIEEILFKENPCNFNVFKSQVKHRLKTYGDKNFIYVVLKRDFITTYYENKEYNKALYLLAFLDTLCKRNNIPIVSEYDKYRKYCLENKYEEWYADYKFLPEFLKYNIYEVSIDDAC